MLKVLKPFLAIFTVLAACFLGLALGGSISKADNTSPWLSTYDPELTVAGTTTQPYNPMACEQATYTTRPSMVLPYYPYVQTEQKISGCFTNTLLGDVDGNGWLHVPGIDYAMKITDESNNQRKVIGFPGSSSLVTSFSGRDGQRSATGLFLWIDNGPSFMVHPNGDGSANMIISSAGTRKLADRSGRMLDIDTGSISVSNNGRWMIAYAHGTGFVRVDLNTLEVTPFGRLLNYGLGIGPNPRTAISADGRYALVGSAAFYYLQLFDLNTCSSVPDYISGPVTCQSKDLQAFMTSKISGFSGLYYAEFASDTTIGFYSGSNPSTKYSLSPNGLKPSVLEYLGLGDSFSSGEGAYQYELGTDESNNKCHLSRRSYPYLIAQGSFNSFHSVACSGAVSYKLANGIGTTRINEKPAPENDNQYSDKNSEQALNNFYPGYAAQVEFVKEYQPDVITLSAIGNDIGFKDIITRCIEPDTCYDSYEDRYELAQLINSKFIVLIKMYDSLKRAGKPDMRIYVVGYPEIASDNPFASCADNVRLNAAERVFANQLVDYLNDMIRRAAAKSGVYYADITNSLERFRYCENDSQFVAVNGVTKGNDLPTSFGPIANESFHPNAWGQFLMSEAIKRQTNNLAAPMPAADAASKPSDITDSLPLLSRSKSGRKIYNVNYNQDLTDNVIVRGGAWGLVLKARNFLNAPSSPAEIWANSTPTFLGIATSDAQGDISTHVTIPADFPIGYHTLHIYTKNLLGQDIDIQKIIFVAASTEDYDGDGIMNEDEACLYGEPSGKDQDKDGLDDACDDFIDQAPAEIAIAGGHTSSASTAQPASAVDLSTSTLSQIQTATDETQQSVLGNDTLHNSRPTDSTNDLQEKEADTTRQPSQSNTSQNILYIILALVSVGAIIYLLLFR